jgi:hypothetical protein
LPPGYPKQQTCSPNLRNSAQHADQDRCSVAADSGGESEGVAEPAQTNGQRRYDICTKCGLQMRIIEPGQTTRMRRNPGMTTKARILQPRWNNPCPQHNWQPPRPMAVVPTMRALRRLASPTMAHPRLTTSSTAKGDKTMTYPDLSRPIPTGYLGPIPTYPDGIPRTYPDRPKEWDRSEGHLEAIPKARKSES